MAFDPLHPGSIGSNENQLGVIGGRPLPDILAQMGREVVQDDIDPQPARITERQVLQEVPDFFSALAPVEPTSQVVGTTPRNAAFRGVYEP